MVMFVDPTIAEQYAGYNQMPPPLPDAMNNMGATQTPNQQQAGMVDYMSTPMAQAMTQQYEDELARQEGRFQENIGLGMDQIKNLMAGQGMLYSGETQRGIADFMHRYRPDLAAPDIYGAYMQNLGQLASSGQGASTNLSNLAIGQGASMGNAIQAGTGAQNQYGMMGAQLQNQNLQNLLNTVGTIGNTYMQTYQQPSAMQTSQDLGASSQGYGPQYMNPWSL